MKKIISVIVVIFSLSYINISAQTNILDKIININEIIPKSPESEMVFKKIYHDVEKYTGAANINIPLGSIECGSLYLPISLSYNTRGNKVSDISSWVGFGWALNTGGMITRRIAGIADDEIGECSSICTFSKGFLYTRDEYSSAEFHDQIDYYLNNPPTDPMSDLITLPAAGCLDTEPDEFAFQVNGYSGTMRFNWDDEYPVVISKYDFKIGNIMFESSSNKRIIGWELIGPNGNHYFFEETEARASLNCSTPDYFSSWYLTKIIDPNNVYQLNIDYTEYYYKIDVMKNYYINYKWNPNNEACANIIDGVREDIWNDESNEIYYLCKIPNRIYNSTDGREVKFVPSNNDRTDIISVAGSSIPMLDKIKFYDTNGDLLDYTEFNYFNQGRPLLKSIQKIGLLFQSEQPFIFSYDKTYFPNYNSFSVDHWGYYNGKINSTYIPKFKKGNILYAEGANRWSELKFCKAAVLEKITYPAGGFIKYNYELNDYFFSDLSAGHDSNEEEGEGGADFKYLIGDDDKKYNVDASCSDTEPIIDNPFPEYLDLIYSENGWIMKTEEFTITEPLLSNLKSYGIVGEDGDGGSFNPYGYVFLIKVGDPSFTIQWGFLQGDEPRDESFELPTGNYVLGALIQPFEPIDGKLCPFSIYGILQTFVKPKTGGGLRIKSEEIFDGQKINIKRYIYNKQIEDEEGDLITISSGHLVGVPKYIFRQPYIYNEPFVWFDGNSKPHDGNMLYLWPILSISGNSRANTPLTKGGVIGYDKVTEIFGDEGEFGSKEFYYSNPLNPEYEISWVAPWGRPVFDDFTKGNLLKIITKDNTSTIRTEEIFEYTFNTTDFYELKISEGPYGYDLLHPNFFPCSSFNNPACPCPQYNPTFLEMFAVWEKTMTYGYAQLESKQTKIDGVTTTQNYIYDYKKQNVLSSSLTDGDNVKTTTYQYAEQLNEENLLDKHMVNKPLQVLINGGLGSGSAIEYTKVGDMVLPKKSYSANENGVWKPQSEAFYNGTTDPYPDKFKSRNQFGDEYLTWGVGNDFGLLQQNEYGERNWVYKYNNLRQLTSITDNAGIESVYKYDGLGRLSNSNTNNGRVNITYTYQYAGTSGDENKITNVLSYPGSSTISDLTIENIFDGLGRPIETRKLQFTQDGNDFVTKKVYDEMGRVALDCDPSKGGCTEYEYEASPLNRITKIKPPGTDKFITIEYGTNSETIGDYGPNTLFLKKTTDENGIVSEEYTDIFGRKIQEVVDAGGLNLKTTYIYNDRDQVTTIIPPNEVPYEYTYYDDGLLHTKTIPDKGTYTYTYNQQDQIEYETLPNGKQLHYIYKNPYNDLLETVELDGVPIKNYDYDEIKAWKTAETLSLFGETGTISNTFAPDDIGRIKNETLQYLNGKAEKNYEYDGANNILNENIIMNGPGQSVTIKKKFEYNKGVRLVKTTGNFPEVGATFINNIHYNDNEWMNEKIINGNQPIDYGYTTRGRLNKINGLTSTYPPGFVPCDSDDPEIDCDGPYVVTDISVLYNCIDLGLQQATNVVLMMASSIYNSGGTQTDTTTLIVPLNGGTQAMVVDYQNQMTASIPAGSNPQSTIEDVIQTIKDCLEENQTGGVNSSSGGPGLSSMIMQTQNEYALNNLATMMADALAGPGGLGTDPVEGDVGHPSFVPGTLFGMKLYYEQGNGDLVAPAQYNGNISWMEWRVAGELKHQYGFDYDGVNRLLYAKYKGKNEETCKEMPPGAYDVKITGYDNMGNILGITRKGLTDIVDDIPQYGVIDQMSYTYNPGTNLLQSISESGNTQHGFKNSTTYGYDGQGNMTSDGSNISNITYSDYLDLPLKIEAQDGYIEMVYDADGRKLRQRYYKAGGALEKEYLYQDGVEYKDGNLESIYHEEGRIVYDGDIPNAADQATMTYREFFLKDHLGNTRVRFVDKDGDGVIQLDTTNEKFNELTGSYHYYPFGMQWEGGHYRKDPVNPPPTQGNFFAPQNVINKYRYNGKEYIEDYGIGLYDYGARWYDAAVGRFMSVDPLAEKYPGWSPYAYVANNPVNGIDPDGRDGILLVWKDYKISAYGRKWSNLGHAGVLLIDNKTGYTKYYEYGRYNSDQGNVRSYRVPNLVMEDNGRPTTESLNKVLKVISDKSGKGGAVSGAYIESNDFDVMKTFAQDLYEQRNDPNREPYSIFENNCGTFACDVLNQDPEVAKKTPYIVDPRPNSIIDEYRDKFDKVDYNSKDGATITPTRSLFDRVMDYFKKDDQ